jgi:hypothetical protein
MWFAIFGVRFSEASEKVERRRYARLLLATPVWPVVVAVCGCWYGARGVLSLVRAARWKPRARLDDPPPARKGPYR